MEYQRSLEDQYKFQAALQGIDLDKDKNKTKDDGEKNTTVPQFGSPDDYKHLTEKEKDDLTAEMKKKHASWVNSTKRK